MPELSNKIKIILFIDLIVFVICIFGVFQTFEKAGLEPNTQVSFNVSDGKVVVAQISNPELKSVLSKDDRIVSIENHPISCKEDIEFVFDSFSVGKKTNFLIDRNGIEIQKELTLPRYYSLLYLIVQILVGCVFFVNGVFVIYKRPTDLAARIWHWATICTAIIIMCTWGRFSTIPLGSGHFIRNTFSVAYAFLPTLYLHVTYVFPRIKLDKPNIIFKPLYGFSLILALYLIVTFDLAAGQFSMDWFHNYLIAFDINRIYFAIVILFGMGNLIHSYIKAREESEKRKIRWILSGLAIGPPTFVIFWQIPQLLSFDSLIPEEIIVLFMIVVPITFTISIVKYHIFDIDIILRRSSVYFLIISIILLLYIGLIAIVAFVIGSFTLSTSIIASVITATIIPLIFEPARIKVQHFVDRKFFRVHYNYRLAQRGFTNDLNNCINIDSMAKMVVDKLDQLLLPVCIGIYLLEEDSRKWKLYTGLNCKSISENTIQQLAKINQEFHHTLFANKNFVEAAAEFKELSELGLPMEKLALVFPIYTQQKDTVGFIICGTKKSDLQYSLEDLDLLKTICAQTGLAIERIRLQKKLILQSEETKRLQELNQTKSHFVSSVSHEMQTPLTSIKMFAELLQSKTKVSEKDKKEYFEIIEGESDRLARLIKNVLDFSKIERGIKDYKFKEVDLRDVVESVIRSMKYQLKQHNFLLDTEYPDQEIKITVDEDAIIEVISNLISNSIKYSSDNKYISVSMIDKGESIIIEISDKGIGISVEDQKHIFEAFYRSEGENVQTLGGAGLGLTIVQDIIKAHNGKIEIESKLGKGSTFRLILPKNIS
jgi:signal transduction histidine kinase